MSNRGVDFTGKKVGMLTVIEKLPERDSHRNILWRCVCDCGKEKIVPTSYFGEKHTSRHIISCGCMANPIRDLTGKRFGRWTVLSKASSSGKDYKTRWNCVCDCGTKAIVQAGNLLSGASVSCGCYLKEITGNRSRTHGDGYGVRLYRIWMGMRQRCNNPNAEKYPIYGERGIKVCLEWNNSYPAFKEWALNNGYAENLTLDRIDNDGDYCPQNCRWLNNKDQCNHKRNNVCITYKGVTKTISQWAEDIGISKSSLAQRKRDGWTDEECIETPKGKRRSQAKAKWPLAAADN